MLNFDKKLRITLLAILAISLSACSSFVATSTSSPSTSPLQVPSATITQSTTTNNSLSGYVIGIDAGHQLKGNNSTEKSGPNSSVMKAKVTSGATGNDSGIREQFINLQVAKKLQTKLKSLGATVIMTRTTEDVNISNIERAELFNKSNVDFAIRIHCDSSTNRSINGLSILIPDKKNNASIYNESKRLADSLIGPMCKSTGAANRGVIQRDDQTGFNWSSVPIVTVEMGFLSNSSEEAKLITSSYQDKLVSGYAQGILQYVSK